jgi:mRNA deadenylase 3'-5' endonuclease subunit Ccr4
VRLCEKSTGIQFVVVSTHITHRYYLPDLQCAEIVAILADLAKFVQPTDMAVFFGGDFNCIPGSLPYLLITQGSVDAVPKTEGVKIPRFLLPPHIQFVFESSYRAHRGTEPDCTTKTEDFEGVLDYIWFSANGTGSVKAIDTKLTATTVLQNIEKGNPIPSATYPSDHLHLVASFLIQRQ